VDGGRGADQGVILHHPLFQELAARGKVVPDKFRRDEFRVPTALLRGEGDAAYRDPLGRFDDEYGLARQFDKRWLAASAPVLPPIGAAEQSESGLVVLVQSDYRSVVQPARQLGEQFVHNSFWMLVVMVTVSLSLWYIVVRLFRESTAGLNRPATPMPISTPLHGMTTLALTRQKP
jgi:hypothetical protein